MFYYEPQKFIFAGGFFTFLFTVQCYGFLYSFVLVHCSFLYLWMEGWLNILGIFSHEIFHHQYLGLLLLYYHFRRRPEILDLNMVDLIKVPLLFFLYDNISTKRDWIFSLLQFYWIGGQKSVFFIEDHVMFACICYYSVCFIFKRRF